MPLLRRKHTKPSRQGTPAYDAKIHPAVAEEIGSVAARVQEQTGRVLFGHASAAAEAYSHFRAASPNTTAVALMGLAQSRDVIQRQVDRVDDQPWPGVKLGPLPSFARSPDTSPIIGPADQLRHHAHQVESKRATRRRFGS